MNVVNVCVYPYLGALYFERMRSIDSKFMPGGAVVVGLTEVELEELFDMSDQELQARLNELRYEVEHRVLQ